jgi:hypothetical protein
MNKGKSENVRKVTGIRQGNSRLQFSNIIAVPIYGWNTCIHLRTKLEGSCQASNNSYWVFKTELLQLWTECILLIFQVNWRSGGKKLFPCQSLLRWFWRLWWRRLVRENAAVRNSIQTVAPESLKQVKAEQCSFIFIFSYIVLHRPLLQMKNKHGKKKKKQKAQRY